MSLLFERALAAFSPGDATHVRATRDGIEADGGPRVDLGDLAALASNRASELADPDREGWLRVPLHGTDDAELTGEYVVYEDHPLRGDVFVYRDGETGDPEAIGCDAAGGTALGRRLRFWTTEFDPDERPSYAGVGPTTRVEATNPIPEGEREAYFDRLERFVEEEREGRRERNRERARRHSPGELAAGDGDAIPELVGFAETADGGYQFRVAGDGDVRGRYGIYEDDEVLVHVSGGGGRNDAEGFPLPATVERIAGDAVDLVPADSVADADAAAAVVDDAETVGLSLLLNPVSYDRESRAVRTVREDPRRREIVVGDRPATFADGTARRTAPRDRDLNREQAFAATAALYADDVCCIHGPPGTGKTRALIEIARRAVADGERVLVCADSNQGVDNAVVGASTEGDPDEASLHYYATVEGEFSLDRHHEYRSDYELVRETYDGDPDRADVVATTNNSAADFPDGAFDLALVDEATQATTQSGLIPFTKAETLVLAGDHKQLPPFSASDDPAGDERDRSLFEHFYTDEGVYGDGIGVLLTTQYRMHEEIAAFSDRRFYGGALETGREVDPVGDLPPLLGVDVRGDERIGEGHSHYNPTEAKAVARLVGRVLDAGVPPEEIGVVTPYRAQVSAVERELADLSADTSELEVATIDSFQGSEREAIVISFVRSNDGGDVGFLGREADGPRRLNVALTRAERFCGLVGDWDTLRTHSDTNACADLYADLYERLRDDGRMREEG